ncbi:hypothetical protein OAE39_01040 [Akkermansiaceae bacterium]|nr:hypothetical protein [Akkermansiaceae bacterium]
MNDHARIKVTLDADMNRCAREEFSIALQGRKMTNDLVEGAGREGRIVGMDLATKIGTEMISIFVAKVLRANI